MATAATTKFGAAAETISSMAAAIFRFLDLIRFGGEAGNDTIYLGNNSGGNIAYGGIGNDIIWGSEYSDALYGDDGNDTLYTGYNRSGATDSVYGGSGNDTINMNFYSSGTTILDGGTGDDVITLNNGMTTFARGGDGTDIFNVNTTTWTTNHFDGGAGFDAIYASANNSRVGIATIAGIEQISAQHSPTSRLSFPKTAP